MRAVAVSVWIFINLVFFGMCGYIYLLWSQYWHYLAKKQQENGSELKKMDHRPLVDYYQEQMPMEILHMQRQALKFQTPAPTKVSKPRFSSHGLKSATTRCKDCHQSDSQRYSIFKSKLILRLRSVLYDESNVFKSKTDNPYGVVYKKHRRGWDGKSGQSDELLCALKESVPFVRTITGKEKAFLGTDVGRVVPYKPLLPANARYNTCAIVSNAGALNGSNLGKIIDGHDVVLRFNHAPTKGYEADVGSKTTIRILNSQVASKKHFRFLRSRMYTGINILVWDPCNYTSTLEQWRDKPDFDVFTPYVKHRLTKPDTNVHLLDPRVLWRLWDFIQDRSSVRLRPNPPSSGFLGVALLLPYCNSVRLMEYVPSLRLTSRCHYFDTDIDASCTFGVWHPLAAEKLLAMRMNEADDATTYGLGYISIKGYPALNCP